MSAVRAYAMRCVAEPSLDPRKNPRKVQPINATFARPVFPRRQVRQRGHQDFAVQLLQVEILPDDAGRAYALRLVAVHAAENERARTVDFAARPEQWQFNLARVGTGRNKQRLTRAGARRRFVECHCCG
jgi:hypothetical protein